jgi:hypothetical protein
LTGKKYSSIFIKFVSSILLTCAAYNCILKKITALFIIILFLFNLFGYRIVVDYMQQKADAQLEASLDNNAYDDSQLIELKVPINVPYQTNWSAYQRFDGEVEVNGVLYKYVKRKVVNDTLYVMCIPNTKKMHLQSAKDDFFKISNDLLQNNSSKKSDNSKSNLAKVQLSDYIQYLSSINRISFSNNQACWLPVKFQKTPSSPHVSPEQPPDSNIG